MLWILTSLFLFGSWCRSLWLKGPSSKAKSKANFLWLFCSSNTKINKLSKVISRSTGSKDPSRIWNATSTLAKRCRAHWKVRSISRMWNIIPFSHWDRVHLMSILLSCSCTSPMTPFIMRFSNTTMGFGNLSEMGSPKSKRETGIIFQLLKLNPIKLLSHMEQMSTILWICSLDMTNNWSFMKISKL